MRYLPLLRPSSTLSSAKSLPAGLLYIVRSFEGKIGADQDDVNALLESTIVRGPKRKDERAPLLLTSRREALALYREIFRYSNLFVWKDERGRIWRDVIRKSAREEYEAARFEQDPELINKMIVTGRDAVQRTIESFKKRREQIIDEEAKKPTTF
jgi:hypothetical protein